MIFFFFFFCGVGFVVKRTTCVDLLIVLDWLLILVFDDTNFDLTFLLLFTRISSTKTIVVIIIMIMIITYIYIIGESEEDHMFLLLVG